MSIFKKLFSGGLSNVIKETGKVIDDLTTSKEEKLELKNKFKTILEDFAMQHQKELTERHRIDMMSDNKLSKNIRPLSYIVMISVVLICSVLDGSISTFSVGKEYIELYKILLMAMTAFYFGGRTWEKLQKIKNSNNK